MHELPDFSQARVLVYGDVMLDRYWSGGTSRISPEAPVPVVSVSRQYARAGGAANVALNLAALHTSVTCLGMVGQDSSADELHSLLKDAGIDSQLRLQSGSETITKLRVMSQNQQLIRLDFESPAGMPPSAECLQDYQRCCESGCQVVVLSDYNKGALSDALSLIDHAKQQGCAVLIDPKQHDFSVYRGATLLTPNSREFEAVMGPCVDLHELTNKAQLAIRQFDLTAILVTRGSDGMLLVERSGAVTELDAVAQEVYDVTGAGDTVIAVIAASLASGLSMQHSVYLANVAAGLVVRKVGAATVSQAELRRQMQELAESHNGVVSEVQALQLVDDAKACGETVVMTNGCFDILHAGHIQYLEQAKQLGQRLLVAVNSDESVHELKGDRRPINPLPDRMAVLAALQAVDWVVPFSESTPQRLIEVIVPLVLV